jgi:ABC-2 type transport system permease protein
MTAGSLAFFARHELRLAWRDWRAMMTMGRSSQRLIARAGALVFVGLMHVVAYTMVRSAAEVTAPGPELLIAVTGTLALSWLMMLSQGIESVTRAFYARADLDLILSSPASARRIFAIRLTSVAVTLSLMAMLLAMPFVNVLVVLGGLRWLSIYGVLAAMGMSAAAAAVVTAVGLLKLVGPRHTRLIAQIVAAIIGAAFLVLIQTVAVTSQGQLSRSALLPTDLLLAYAPHLDSPLWWPARAAFGDGPALLVLLSAGAAVMGIVVTIFAGRFAGYTIATASVAQSARAAAAQLSFRRRSPQAALRAKEWVLLRRDPWLISQTLMQILYLVPPALLLWRGFPDGIDGLNVIVPVIVMAGGQLAGGLAWLAVSGEDAPDLMAGAPVLRGAVLRAKIEAVLGAIAFVFAPFVTALAFMSAPHALAATAGIVAAASSATAIQLWFRAQAKRSQFRRRHTSSRVATFAEAFSSIAWAGAAAVAAVQPSFAVAPATFALGVVFIARAMRPTGG